MTLKSCAFLTFCTEKTAHQGRESTYMYIYITLVHVVATYDAFEAESVDSISRDEPDSPLTQYITNAGISRARYTITHFKHHHRVLLYSASCVAMRYALSLTFILIRLPHTEMLRGYTKNLVIRRTLVIKCIIPCRNHL